MKTKQTIRKVLKVAVVIFAVLLFPVLDASERKKNSARKMSVDSFEIINVRPGKVFTPNGDGWNDYFEITYSNPQDSRVKGVIYSKKSVLVSYMDRDLDRETLKWNGNDLNGNPAQGGIYIYQIEITGGENRIINGTVVVAR